MYGGISVQDFGIDNKTIADGLAVGRASGFVGKTIEPFLSGAYTISDNHLYKLLTELVDKEDIKLEPSALAGMIGPIKLHKEGRGYLQNNDLKHKLTQSTHIVWGTGGSMVPKEVMEEYYQTGSQLIKKSFNK